MDALFELLKELIQDSEGVPSLDAVSTTFYQSPLLCVLAWGCFPACLETRFVASCSPLTGSRLHVWECDLWNFYFLGGWRRFSGGTKPCGTSCAYVGEWWSWADVPGKISFPMEYMTVATMGVNLSLTWWFSCIFLIACWKVGLTKSQFPGYITLQSQSETIFDHHISRGRR